VDEIVRRLKEGTPGPDAQPFYPRVCRVGAESSVNLNVRDVFLDELVDNALGSAGKNSDELSAKIQGLRKALDDLKKSRTDSAKALEEATSSSNAAAIPALEAAVRAIRKAQQEKTIQLQDARDRQQQSHRSMDVSRRKARMEILSSADVICTTLSGAGHDYMAALQFDFDTVIIDEAAQSVEPSSLIPLKYGCRRCILVGDPQQLPPTVLSRVATNAGYDRSLFTRIQTKAADAVHLLSSVLSSLKYVYSLRGDRIQYRMHPEYVHKTATISLTGNAASARFRQSNFMARSSTMVLACWRRLANRGMPTDISRPTLLLVLSRIHVVC
jgi:senataxin